MSAQIDDKFLSAEEQKLVHQQKRRNWIALVVLVIMIIGIMLYSILNRWYAAGSR